MSAAPHALAAVFGQFGHVATYTAPDGTVVEGVRVLVSQPDQIVELSGIDLTVRTTTLEVRVTDLAAPAAGGTFALADGRTVEITQPPTRQDPDRLIWTIEGRET